MIKAFEQKQKELKAVKAGRRGPSKGPSKGLKKRKRPAKEDADSDNEVEPASQGNAMSPSTQDAWHELQLRAVWLDQLCCCPVLAFSYLAEQHM